MKRVISFLLAVSLIASLSFVPASAVETKTSISAKDVLYDTASVSQWNAYFSDVVFGDLANSVKWAMLDTPVAAAGVGSLSSYSALASAESKFLYKHRDIVSNPVYSVVKVLVDGKAIVPAIAFDESLGVYRLIDERSGLWIVSSNGSFPYFKEVEVSDPDPDGSQSSSLGGKWVRIDKVSSYKNVVNEATLNDLVVGLVNAGEKVKMEVYQDKYKGIQSKTRYENGIPFVYCDSQSRQYVMQLDPDQWNVNNDHNIYIEDPDGDGVYDDGQTSNEQLIDVDNNTVWFPDGTLNFIENLIYDESTRTYYVDAHSEYNVTNNTYITNNYHYEYHINYTNVTYIGTTAEYDKLYEFYYELPDGRSSADLTAEELLALNADIDVVPYIRSADNTSLRFLYHFDGNTFDSSFWSYDTSFTWNEGASITYMDSGTFNGCLYLDENVHDFTITAPKAVGSQDFTLQWRMYNSYTAAPVTDSYVSFGGTKLLQFSGEYATFNGTQYATPVGNWYEVALIRENGTLRFYLNGIQVASKTQTTNFLKDIVFHFGSEQQTYKQLDEMRFLNFPLVEGGADYTPTSVPYDTNLTLVLPDSTVPVADEYWSLVTEGNLLTPYDFTEPIESDSWLEPNSSALDFSDGPYLNDTYWMYRSGSKYTTVSLLDGFMHVANNTSSAVLGDGDVLSGLSHSFGDFRLSDRISGHLMGFDFKFGQQYSFSLLLADGQLYTLEFTIPEFGTGFPYSGSLAETELPNGGVMGVTSYRHSSGLCHLALQIIPGAKSSLDIVYWEMKEGAANTGHEHVTGIAPVSDDFKTPTLAVRTSHEITGYQIGGVRPSVPSRGLVWGLVEDGRITSLQIYNGQAWEAVDGRIWTGERWIPYSSYNVILMKDMYDIIEADPSLEYIYTEQGFWAWLQKSWAQMMDKLEAIRLAITGSGGGSGTVPGDSSDTTFPGGEDDPSTEEDEGWSFLELLVVLKDGAWKIVKGVVSTGVGGLTGLVEGISNAGNYFDAYESGNPDGILSIYEYGGKDIWD